MHDHKPSFDAVPLAEAAPDKFETGVLAIARYFMSSFADPVTQAWQMGFSIAAERWGMKDGPRIALATLTTIQALHRCRATEFRHSNPTCPTCRTYVTPEELALLRMLREMRQGRTAQARQMVAELTGDRLDPTLIQAGLALAALRPLSGGVEPQWAAAADFARVH